MRRMCLLIIRTYRFLISPVYGRVCRFEPTCSQYAYEAVERYGAFHGLALAVVRLMKCHPFHPGGEDPVK